VASDDAPETGPAPTTGGQNATCIGCHEHSRARSDDHNDEVGGYAWDAADPDFCRRCHSDGRED
jgi:hypothetical protein